MFNVRRAGFVMVLVALLANTGTGGLTDGLVAYWPFNGDARDASGNGNHGIVHGPTLIPDWSGCPDSAYRFDGQNDYIDIGNRVKPPLPLSVAMWVKVDSFEKDTCVFRNDLVNHGGYRYGLDIQILLDRRIATQLYQGFSAPWNRRTYSTKPLLKDNEWHHICSVYNADILGSRPRDVSLYFDGQEHSAPFSDGSGSGMVYTGYTGAIGHHVSNASYVRSHFLGSIDEVRVYSRALSAREVTLLLELPRCTEVPQVTHVDDDAAEDPGPGDAEVSDPAEDGSKEHPFDMIQEGIDAAIDGDTVIVREGTYFETIEFKGKRIEVTSFDPEGDELHAYPVIDAGYAGTVVTFNEGANPNCRLSGFVLTRGLRRPNVGSAAAVSCVHASPHITRCVIVGNRCMEPEGSDPLGGAIYCRNSNAFFENCTITDNYGGAGLYLVQSNVGVSNCIMWGNVPQEIDVESGDAPIVGYTNILGSWPGPGNTDAEPEFAFPGYWADRNNPDMAVELDHPDAMWLEGDYHLMSKAGRWDPQDRTWRIDGSRSPCIDAGDPDSPWENEPQPNGGRINLGAYGGTPQASMSTDQCCLTITATEGGRVILPDLAEPNTVEPGETKVFCFDCGETVTMTVAPDPNHHFAGWPTELGGMIDANDASGTTIIVAIDRDASYTPDFPRNNLRIVPPTGGGGSVMFPDGEPSDYDRGTPVRIVAEPDPCYHFAGWSGTAVDAGKVADPESEDTTILVDGDYTLIANFAPDGPSDLTISSTVGGSVAIPGEGVFSYDCGTPVDVLAISESCYHFAGWTGTAVAEGRVLDPNDPNTTVTIDANYTLIANFTVDQMSLTLSSTVGGSVAEPGEGVFAVDCGTSVSVEAVPEPGYRFARWTGTAADAGKVANPTDPNTIVTVDGDYTLQAHFELAPCTLTTTSSVGGSVTVPGEGVFTFDSGTSVQVMAVPDGCYRFSHWTGTAVEEGKVGNVTDPSTTVLVDGDYTLQGNFELVQYTLTLSSTGGGSVIVPGEGTFEYACGTVVRLEAQADACYRFIGWTGTAVDAGKVAEPGNPNTTVTMKGDCVVQAQFELIQYTLTMTSTRGGSVSKPGEGVFEYDCGTSVSIEAVADEHAEFTGWSGTAVENGKVADATLAATTVTIDGDYTLQANFRIHQHTVTLSSTAGGFANLTVDEGDTSRSWLAPRTLQFEHGTKIIITAAADPGYRFKNWSGTIYSTASCIEFILDQDYDLTANFVVIQEP